MLSPVILPFNFDCRTRYRPIPSQAYLHPNFCLLNQAYALLAMSPLAKVDIFWDYVRLSIYAIFFNNFSKHFSNSDHPNSISNRGEGSGNTRSDFTDQFILGPYATKVSRLMDMFYLSISCGPLNFLSALASCCAIILGALGHPWCRSTCLRCKGTHVTITW